MTKWLFLLPLLTLACAQAPKKEYRWVSLSDKGYTAHQVTVLKESKQFDSERNFENLEIKKQALSDTASGSPIPPKRDAQKIILIGDTGCRLKETPNGNKYQDCRNPADWVYPEVAKKIAEEKPDLIIHVGDYHYREQCSEGQSCRKMTETIGYGWKTWEADFFAPSKGALQTAPWIFIRGNHEDCKRAFEGYKILTDQTWSQACDEYEKPEFIQVGDLLILKIDSTEMVDAPDKTEQVALWEKRFNDIDAQLKNYKYKYLWLVTHKPFIGVAENRDNQLWFINMHAQKALAQSRLAKKIDLLIGGHIHNTQFVEVENFPAQLVVGNSGTALDVPEKFAQPEKIIGAKVGGLKITQFSTDLKNAHSFGYAIMTKDAAKESWSVHYRDVNGSPTMGFASEKNQDKKPATKPKPKKAK